MKRNAQTDELIKHEGTSYARKATATAGVSSVKMIAGNATATQWSKGYKDHTKLDVTQCSN